MGTRRGQRGANSVWALRPASLLARRWLLSKGGPKEATGRQLGSKSHWQGRISRNKPPMALADQTSTRGESHAPRDTTGGPQATPCRRLTRHARSMATSGRLGWGAGGACSTEGAPLPCPRPSPVRPGRRPCPGGPCPASTPHGAALRRLGQAVLVQTDGYWGSAARGSCKQLTSRPISAGKLRRTDGQDLLILPTKFELGRASLSKLLAGSSGDELPGEVCHPTSGCAAAAP